MRFVLLIEEIRNSLQEKTSLQDVQREINPLVAKGSNPIKTVVDKTARARETGRVQDIDRARSAHEPAIRYADEHGLPRLKKQLAKHRTQLAKILPKAKSKPKENKRSIGTKRSVKPR